MLSFYRKVIIVIVCGLAAGISSAIFLQVLELITNDNFISYNYYFLPLAGLLIVYLYQKFSPESNQGNNLLINNKFQIPLLMAPLVLLGTWLSHLVGASVGREGTAVQMSGSISFNILNKLKLIHNNEDLIIKSAIAAGFSAVFGTPLAGIAFAFEINKNPLQKRNLQLLFWVLFASYIGHFTCIYLGTKHSEFNPILIDWNLILIPILILLSVIFGLSSSLFIYLQEQLKLYFKKNKINPYILISLGSIILIIIFSFPYFLKYQSLGVKYILDSFKIAENFETSILKLIITVFTLSIGFKGGEVTPLFFIGASAGSFWASTLGFPIEMGAGLGLIGVFSAATKSPICCIFLGVELFGLGILLPAILVSYLSCIFSIPKSIYTEQEIPKYLNFQSIIKVK